jgi:hypothetical protein
MPPGRSRLREQSGRIDAWGDSGVYSTATRIDRSRAKSPCPRAVPFPGGAVQVMGISKTKLVGLGGRFAQCRPATGFALAVGVAGVGSSPSDDTVRPASPTSRCSRAALTTAGPQAAGVLMSGLQRDRSLPSLFGDRAGPRAGRVLWANPGPRRPWAIPQPDKRQPLSAQRSSPKEKRHKLLRHKNLA